MKQSANYQIVKMSEKNNYHSVISEMSDHKTELF